MSRSSVLACLVFALAAAVPFQPWADSRTSSSAFEVRVDSDASGLMRLYYDVGRGLDARDAAVQPVRAGRPALLRFGLPRASIRALTLEILDRDARMTLGHAEVVDGSGRVRVSFAPGQFHPAGQVDVLAENGGDVVVRTSPGAEHPRVTLDLDAPIEIGHAGWWVGTAVLFAVLLALVEAARRAPTRVSRAVGSLGRAAAAAPGRAVMAVAFAATVAANYPVIFAGKSLVSPNMGSALLYGRSPWVPGFQSTEEGNAGMADIDPVLWHHLPLSMIEHRALFHDGELPLWNRYDSGGSPLLGQGQSCFGDPLSLIPIVANGAAWAWDLKFLLAKWAFACGIGFCAWRLTRHLPATLALAASAQFIGFFVYRINHPAIFSLCYSPWILYCWLRVLDSGSTRGSVLWMAALAGVNFTEMNSGTVKEAYVLLLWMNLSGICLLLTCARPWREKARLAACAAAAGVVFALVSSPVWLTFYDALKVSYTAYNAPQAFQIQPGLFAGLFDEALYRPFQLYSNVANPSANFFVLLGVLWAAVRWRTVWEDPRARGLVLASVPALMLAFGVVPPALVTRVPFLGNILHIDNAFSCALIILFFALAAFGWKEAWERLGSEDGRREGIAVVVLVALVYAAYLGTAQAVVRSAYFDDTWGKIIRVGGFVHAYGLSLVAACALWVGVLHRARGGRAWTPALVIYAVLALAALHGRQGLHLASAFPDYVVMPTGRVDLQADSPTVNAVLAMRDTPGRAVGFMDNLFPGWSIVYGIEGICGPDALVNRYYRQLMDASGMERLWDWRYRLRADQLKSVRPLLDALNVRFYLDYPPGRREGREGLAPLLSSDMELFESRSCWPRAFFTDGILRYGNPGELWARIRDGDGRPFAAIQDVDWPSLHPSPVLSGDLAGRSIQPARDYALTTNSTSFSVTASGPGIIVLTEAYARGDFEATLNGARVPYLRINNAFKGIYVGSPGTYAVRFTYWPRDFTLSLELAGAGLLLGALGLVVAFALTPGPTAAARTSEEAAVRP